MHGRAPPGRAHGDDRHARAQPAARAERRAQARAAPAGPRRRRTCPVARRRQPAGDRDELHGAARRGRTARASPSRASCSRAGRRRSATARGAPARPLARSSVTLRTGRDVERRRPGARRQAAARRRGRRVEALDAVVVRVGDVHVAVAADRDRGRLGELARARRRACPTGTGSGRSGRTPGRGCFRCRARTPSPARVDADAARASWKCPSAAARRAPFGEHVARAGSSLTMRLLPVSATYIVARAVDGDRLRVVEGAGPARRPRRCLRPRPSARAARLRGRTRGSRLWPASAT